jgi:hypothetical protein
MRAPTRLSLHAATLAATLIACSMDALAPEQISVFYSNQSTHINTGAPGTMVVTWLTPGTARQQQTNATPNGAFTWYTPGFRTDTVLPNQVTCVRFEAPDDKIAVEYRITYPGGVTGIGWASRSGVPITWHLESSWGFTGDGVGVAGSAGPFGEIVQGC